METKKQQVPVYGPLWYVVLFFVLSFFLRVGGGVGAKRQGVSTFCWQMFCPFSFGLGDVMDYVIFGKVGVGVQIL